MSSRNALATTALLLLIAITASAAPDDSRPIKPDALLDLTTDQGASAARATWRYSDAKPIETGHRSPGPDLRASGPPNRAHDLSPRASSPDFDDSAWAVIPPDSLRSRRTNGKLSFAWYRTTLTLPDRISDFSVAGSTAVLEITVDDYAELWIDGRLPRALGQSGGQSIRGYNAPNRVILTRHAKPGQQFHLALFAANGPLSQPPDTYVWVRSATIDFYAPGHYAAPQRLPIKVTKHDPSLDDILPASATVERLADGFTFTEGPVWVPANPKTDSPAHLLFSDPNTNTIYRWSDSDGVSVFRTKSGYSGPDIGQYRQPGSNGLALDPQGRLTVAEHGNRRVSRTEPNGVIATLADAYEGKRLNSPNDLTYRSDGTLYFTDPPFGLPKFHADPRRQLPFTAVFRLSPDGKLGVVNKDLLGPNGIALSPDEKRLYVANWDEKRKVIVRHDLLPDGSASGPQVFFDFTDPQRFPGEEALDGLKVDRSGNVYVSGPGGLHVLSPAGKLLGTLRFPELPANFTFGDDDGQSLYLTARTGLYRLRLKVSGRPHGTLSRAD